MSEKFPKNEIFTPEQLKTMEEQAARQERDEAIRAGDYVPDDGPELEEFNYLKKPDDEKLPSHKKLSDIELAKRAINKRNYKIYKTRKDIFE